ncbi:PREDICTED: bifunctional lysine-specific demethylase and histidyl-hydroxylase NO66 [Nanorana parkeri]|uniref:bifunctional lysine-specific demethylase and histidyl-hydroxylase NO66 n=1 Tax=Nanorana parkeri TaxID=125878 RepID=UPI00085436D2|nr:PREDICTED: bifunctional lysine-specific demethylase and histidyl-hydroxylase NO66 [Nanorana parkeri]
MAAPRVSAFSAFQQFQDTKTQTGLKKKRHIISKTEYRLSKKKRKPVKPDPKACLKYTNGVDDDRSVHAPSNTNSSNKKDKKLCTEATNKDLERNIKQHVGPSLECVLKNLGKIQNSKERAKTLFKWLISPIKPNDFFRNIWENKPALIRRHNTKYYDGFFSTSEFDRILREDNVQFGVNLDVTSYTDGVRETHNSPGRALPLVAWDYFKNGCSLRLLNPQAFSVTVWNVLSILQELFGSMVGANAYLTPPATQGFAPHYDDIEAFVVQLEGKKHWRVYSPRNTSEQLPQFSSANFRDCDIGEPILETILEAGDLLYFPRGFIHQGDCLPDVHSLHITISSFQKNSWIDLLEKLLPASLQIAAEEDVEFRKGLPLDYLEYMGVQNADSEDPRRSTFIEKAHSLMKKLTEYTPVDAAVDQKAKAFLHDCLPPVLTPAEKACSVLGAPARWENGGVKDCEVQLEKDSQIRFLRGNIARLCSEGESCLLYYSTDNSRIYHQEASKFIEIDAEHVDAIDFLLHSYPSYVNVDDLPCETTDDKVALITMLFEKGLLTTKEQVSSL